jgi:hypothetical protein
MLKADKKSLSLQFFLTDCLQDPESTALEVVFEYALVDFLVL